MRIPTLTRPLLLLAVVAPAAIPARAAANHPNDGTPASMDVTAENPDCRVTAPNGRRYSGDLAGGNHGNEALVTALWSDGRVDFRPGGPGCVEPDGYLGMKWPWWRSVRGNLTIEGRRLDGSAGPLRASIPKGYGETGFQATGLLFAGPGCWEVTGRVGEAKLSFVTLVVKTADGPTPRCSALFGGFRPRTQAAASEQK